MSAYHVIGAAMPDGAMTMPTGSQRQTETSYLPAAAASHVVTVTKDSSSGRFSLTSRGHLSELDELKGRHKRMRIFLA